MQQLKLVGISFQRAGKIFDFDAKSFELSPGDKVVVETERGRALGTVITAPRETPASDAPPKLKTVIRVADENDLREPHINEEREQEAKKYCQQRIFERKMEMKLVKAEYLFDASKIIFYFTADGRVDFRDLVRDLAQHFRTRIEMRQIGVRDEAKLIGGLGCCGRELCCANHLRDFAPVSVKMAKAQGLALNPSKISGQCGRLLCCLAYEYDTYNKLSKTVPKCGKKVQLPEGSAEVVARDVLAQKVTLSCQGGERCCMKVEELNEKIEQAASGAPAAESKEQPKNAPAQQRQERRPRNEERSERKQKPAAKGQRKQQQEQTQRPKKTERDDKPSKGQQQGAEEEKKKSSPRRRRPRKRNNNPKTPQQPS